VDSLAAPYTPFLFSLPILIIGVISFFRMLKKENRNIIRVYILAFTLQYATIPLLGFFIDWSSDSWNYEYSDLETVYTSLYIYLSAILICLFLYDIFAKKFKILSITDLLIVPYQQIRTKKILLYFVFTTGFLLLFNIMFGFTYYGSGTREKILAVPYYFIVIKSLISILSFGSLGYGITYLIKRGQLNIFILLFIISQIVLEPFARRSYLITFLIIVLFKIIIDGTFFKAKQLFFTAAIGIFITQVFFPFLFVFRAFTNEVASENKNQGVNYSKAYELSNSNKARYLNKSQNENISYRSNQIARMSEIMKLPQREGSYMNGVLLGTQIWSVIPRVFNPNKINQPKIMQEGIIFVFYGRSGYDIPDDFVTYGYLDLGYLGAFLSGLFQGLFLVLFMIFIYRFYKINKFIALAVFSCIVYHHTNLEYGYSQELSLTRELILMLLVSMILSFFRSFFPKSQFQSK